MTQAPPQFDHPSILLGGLLIGRARLADMPELRPEDFVEPQQRILFEGIQAAQAEHGPDATQLQVLHVLWSRPDAERARRLLDQGRVLADYAALAEREFGITAWHVEPIIEDARIRALEVEAMRFAQGVEALKQRRISLGAMPEFLSERFTASFDIVEPIPGRTNGSAPRRTWQPVDLAAVLDGTVEPITPTVGRRDDGVGLFYPGRVHSIASESEGGKTWFALTAALAELDAGNAVLYLDFEDDEAGVVGRLLALGARPEAIRKHFAYLRPESPITDRGNRDDLDAALGDLRPTLAVLDGVTEAMAMHGLEMKDNTDVARFGKLVTSYIADRGPAAVALDHVTKNAEGRGRYQIGAVHKLNGLNGAAYILENKQAFGIGITGRSTVYVGKDRPGQLRRRGLPSRDQLFWFADLVLISHSELSVIPSLAAPAPHDPDKPFRPTHLMGRVSKALETAGEALSQNDVEKRVQGKTSGIRQALAVLVTEGYVAVEKSGKTRLHTFVRPFVEVTPEPAED